MPVDENKQYIDIIVEQDRKNTNILLETQSLPFLSGQCFGSHSPAEPHLGAKSTKREHAC